MGKCHRMTQGGWGSAKVSRDIFFKILSYIHVHWTGYLKKKGYFFFGKSKCQVTRGGPCQYYQMTHGGGGLK
jgi:hypothetical protein